MLRAVSRDLINIHEPSPLSEIVHLIVKCVSVTFVPLFTYDSYVWQVCVTRMYFQHIYI